jgi:hypothetical protein
MQRGQPFSCRLSYIAGGLVNPSLLIQDKFQFLSIPQSFGICFILICICAQSGYEGRTYLAKGGLSGLGSGQFMVIVVEVADKT